ncbi:PRAME family member 12-like [Otolemur garnettii]|uniref:PRAME family member 12-like n=1 Tax=Otolemur garnettii TaxID=30611 RepID=UPI000C7F775F|nr:PRAME family member 12-like [Otolemur garnettii]
MSHQGAPRLKGLAVQSLVRNETLAISALEEQHGLVFPPLFIEAFTERRSRVLTGRVQAWPFTCLPLGFLKKTLWAKHRKESIHLCCRTLDIEVSFQNIRKFLQSVDLDCIQELEVSCHWKLPTLGQFSFYLARMSHLERLLVSYFRTPAYLSPMMGNNYVLQFANAFVNMDRLQKLDLHSDSFLEGHLDQVLDQVPQDPTGDPLMKLTQTLSISCCRLVESDVSHLPWCLTLTQLKHLVLTKVKLTDFSPEPLQFLLERVAATLQTLDLDDYGISDAQLRVILPSLSHCSQLTTFSFCRNQIFMPALEDLIHHTAGLSKFNRGQYPVPLESYHASGTFYREILAQFAAKLRRTLRDSQTKKIFFGPVPCTECGNRFLYDLDMVRQCC